MSSRCLTILFATVVFAVSGCKREPRVVSKAPRRTEPATRAEKRKPGVWRPRGVLAVLDTDGDGVLSAAEIAAAPKSLATLDRNRDGKITSDEVRRRPRLPHKGIARHGPVHARGADEKRIVDVLDDLDKKRIGMMNVPIIDGRLLRLLVEALGAKKVVEIGTSNGYSAIWMALALRETGGHLTTYEIDAGRAGLARANFKRAGVEKLITLIEGDAHKLVTRHRGAIDLLFLDADKKGYVDYLRKLLPHVRPGGLIVGHNMVRPPPDPRYIEAITTDPRLETVFLNMHAVGIGVTLKRR